MHIYKNTLYLTLQFVVLLWLAGCSGVTQLATVTALQLTSAEKASLGSVVEERLIQMLSGPYYDEVLSGDLNSQGLNPQSLKISVADRSASALYPLPGGRVIVTRGLLAGLNSRGGLDSYLAQALQLTNNIYADRVTHGMAETIEEVLSAPGSIYDPDSAVIRLARLFEHESCGQECLAASHSSAVVADRTDSTGLPDSIKRLAGLQAGYELLARARQAEQADDQATAIALYLQAAATTPDEPRILGSLGLAYLRAGQLQPARLHLQKAVKLQPDYYRTQMGLGYLFLQQGKLSQANQALVSSVRLLAAVENLFLLAEVREKNGDVKGAIPLYELVVESDRTSKLGRTSAKRLQQLTGVK
jgi:hypothetical protein